MENPQYTKTIFYDDFTATQLNRSVWNVSAHGIREGSNHKKISIWVDSIATVNQTNGNLNLSMLHYPNYTTTDWDSNPISANFIAGEVNTYTYFSYGVFECNATFANQPGSFPAFWLISAEDCNNIRNNEIDIVELKYNHQNPTLDNNIFHYRTPCGAVADGHEFTQTTFSWGGTHTFKCIWSPSKIEFWVDNRILKEVFNTGQEWFPQYAQRVILSQQIWDYNDNAPLYGIITPQTSNFHWVRVKQFFLAPEITCPSNICSTGTATMNVDIAATNISWALTPSNLFNGATTGSGTTANITASPFSQGKGKITYTFTVGNYGETFTAEKEVWVGIPPTPVITSNQPLTVYTEQDIVLYDANTDTYPGLLDNFNWTWYCDGVGTYDAYDYGVGGKMYIFHEPGTARIRASVANACSSTNLSSDVFVQVIAQRFYLSISPNPASGETTIEIKSTQKEQANQVIVWELEVYDQMRSMKEEKTKLRTAQTKINTSGWKEGVYIIRALVNGEVVTGKLMVKH
jgi:hypothetical protein